MRWRDEVPPKVGDRKIITRFLFSKTCLPNHDGVKEWRWLENAHIQQEYKTVEDIDHDSPRRGGISNAMDNS